MISMHKSVVEPRLRLFQLFGYRFAGVKGISSLAKVRF
jgi:hypothetical protein